MDEINPTCLGCKSTSNSLFRSLNEAETDYLEKSKSCNKYKRGEILYREGTRITGCYCVMSGILKIYKTGGIGKEQIIAFAKSGDITGYRSVISNEAACTTAEIIEEAVICYIPAQVIFDLVKKNSDFSLSLMQLSCKELNQANSYIKDIAQKTVRERLAEVLLMLDKTFGTEPDGTLKVTLTREELANIVGTATESVIRLLSDFKSEKLIGLTGKKIQLLNKALLNKISNFN